MAVRKPYKINATLTAEVLRHLQAENIELPKGWALYVTATVRGRTNYKQKSITVPTWAVEKEVYSYIIWYACHEIAHIHAEQQGVYKKTRKGNRWVSKEGPHGKTFMACLKKVCPEWAIHHELGYKPRNAAMAGIRNPDE
jgi:hypothetical protein